MRQVLLSISEGFPLSDAVSGMTAEQLAERFSRTDLTLLAGQAFYYPATIRWIIASLLTRRGHAGEEMAHQRRDNGSIAHEWNDAAAAASGVGRRAG